MRDKNKKRVMIAGADVYIGTALFNFLAENSYELSGFDNNSREYNIKGGESTAWSLKMKEMEPQ